MRGSAGLSPSSCWGGPPSGGRLVHGSSFNFVCLGTASEPLVYFPSGYTDPPAQAGDSGSTLCDSNIDSELPVMNADMEVIDPESQVELEEKTRLINQVLELQHTLEELSARVDAVKEENLKLKSENQVLGQYIENLMSASSVFQTTDTKGKRK
ncbi:short coiled-coil protein-like isoform X4 [Hypanus sabinus]|uniref:short coiled-coil protein-like isoform X4 n=1 Tax=Hypanus sabinus TaxID=79690 RepID=UPI0028C4A2E7|nr:short coiled-coil protein-like isoform X4 [Hypanus sabinus]XP_059821152.1 short coiled-coil protein-like isoform X4 [Hypanus sabinus]